MEPLFVRERMTRDEMFRKYPNKHLVVLDSEYGIGQLKLQIVIYYLIPELLIPQFVNQS